ncbi:transposon Ty3-I Gag-Pol polyprotein [Trichonephila clavipes]|nr:transposon Ty3-I Gag-Pol polyprotein [Trichonephila clavipes]
MPIPLGYRGLGCSEVPFDADLALKTDASDFGLDSSLIEITSDSFKPLGFFSKKLTPAQTKYSAFDRELLAAYSAINYFRHMIEGRVLILYTDHKPLTFAFNQKLDKASPRQLCHLDFISQFTDFKYVPGIDNRPADAFSRISAIVTPSTIDYEEFAQMQ